jgi:hypothetical protein
MEDYLNLLGLILTMLVRQKTPAHAELGMIDENLLFITMQRIFLLRFKPLQH